MREFRHHRGWNDDAAIQGWQNVDVLDQNEVLKRTGIGDNNHVADRSACRVGDLRLPLFSESSAGLALVFKIVDRVFERNAVALQQSVEFITGREIEQFAELVAGDPVHSVGIDRERLERRSGQVLTLPGKLPGNDVRKV